MNKTARAWTFQLMKKGIILLDINDCVKKKKGETRAYRMFGIFMLQRILSQKNVHRSLMKKDVRVYMLV